MPSLLSRLWRALSKPFSPMLAALTALVFALLALFAVQRFQAGSPWMQAHCKATGFFEGQAPAPALSPTPIPPPPAAAPPSSPAAAVRDLFEDLARGRRSKLRILYYADSLTEGGVLTDTLRRDLQARYGGQGDGFQGIAPRDALDRAALNLRPDAHWRRLGLKEFKEDPRLALGPGAEAYAVDGEAAVLRLSRVHNGAPDLFQTAVLYAGPGSFSVRAASPKQTQTFTAQGTQAFNAYSLDLDPAPSLELELRPAEGAAQALVYGVDLGSPAGVHVDSFSLRGNLGDGPLAVPDAVLDEAQAALGWDLVFVEFGLNALQPGQTSYPWYRAELRRTLRHLRKHLPQARFVVVSVVDHAVKGDAGMVSDDSIPYVLEAQRLAAADEGAAFVDLFHAVGGEGTMRRWVEESPALAYHDYMHPNPQGGAVLARALEAALLPPGDAPTGGKP